MQKEIQEAIKILNQGGVVIFPTDTAFGMGCRIDDEKTIRRLFEIRKRPKNKATPVLVSSHKMAGKYLQKLPDLVVDKLAKPYWPGALTIILPCRKDKVPELVRGGGETLGVRMPDNPTALEIIKAVGVPILGTSANFAGGQTPYKFEDLDPELVKLVDFVVSGECITKQASTVIDCSVTPWKILRPGAVRISI